jgi:twitching motility protein PilT
MQTEGLLGGPNPTGMGLRDGGPQSRVGVAELLEQVLTLGASDLHLTAGAKPTVRVNGRLGQLEDYPVLQPAETQAMIYSILTQRQRERLESEQELDCLVTGPTGSGKSTTLASMVDMANREREDHIMTVEDPIEFLHTHKRCLVNQREVGEDTKSFANALKHVLGQDPDIILVGELRDLETISIALTAAETGHLVFATLHTQDAPQTVDRMIDVFPTNQQQQIRVQLAGALQGVVCQQLVPTADGNGRVVGVEIMMATPAVRNLIRDGKTHQIYSAMQAGGRHGMQTMDQSLADLVRRGYLSYDKALERCHHTEDFNRLCGRAA